jgi:tetratricopeptide (TPR) repeat protein
MAAAFPAAAQTTAPADPMAGMAMPPVFPQTIADWAHGAQIFDGLGSFHREVRSKSPEAQAYFDQGMRFLWSFNHDEATRSFARATELDPACAMCFWGVALTLGPNYNMPMMAQARANVAWDALAKAQANAASASPADRALIAALAKRYKGPDPLDPSNEAPLLKAYSDAMREVAKQFPADLDIQTLFAESAMNLNPWKLWNADGTPAPGTAEIVATLGAVLAKDPMHPGANHYYIHAVEASAHPEKAVAAAERVKGMMPAAGHLEHMPAHIMQRVGRYEDSAEANRKGAAADTAYYAKTNAPDYYPMYSAHNFQFLAYSAAMEGKKAETLAAARSARGLLPDAMLMAMPGIDWSVAYLYEAELRFGEWDAILAEPEPGIKLPGLEAGWLAAHASALAHKGRLTEAEAEVAQLATLIQQVPAEATAGMNPARGLYEIALLRAKARIALARKDSAGGIALLEQALKLEDATYYNEPADIFFPGRHLLGEALLGAGRAADAEAVYREDLKRNPENGWALIGLAKALEAQKKDAGEVRARFAKAWALADVKIDGSAF